MLGHRPPYHTCAHVPNRTRPGGACPGHSNMNAAPIKGFLDQPTFWILFLIFYVSGECRPVGACRYSGECSRVGASRYLGKVSPRGRPVLGEWSQVLGEWSQVLGESMLRVDPETQATSLSFGSDRGQANWLPLLTFHFSKTLAPFSIFLSWPTLLLKEKVVDLSLGVQSF